MLKWTITALVWLGAVQASTITEVTKDYSIQNFNNGVDDFTQSDTERSQLAQIQATIHRITGTQHEFARGIHHLRSVMADMKQHFDKFNKTTLNTVDTIESDMTNLKLHMRILDSKQNTLSGAENTSLATGIFKYMETFMEMHLLQHNGSAQGTQGDYLQLVHYITKSLGHQKAIANSLDGKYNHIKKHIRRLGKSLGALETTVRSKHQSDQLVAQQQQSSIEDLSTQVQNLEDIVRILLASEGNEVLENNHQRACPAGFTNYASSCYHFVNASDTWINAEEHCQTLHRDAHLVGLETKEEQTFLLTYRKHNGAIWSSNYLWIGATDMVSGKAGTWTWVSTQRPLGTLYQNWDDDKPSPTSRWREQQGNEEDGVIDGRQQELCVYLNADDVAAVWSDWPCAAARLNYVCEIVMVL